MATIDMGRNEGGCYAPFAEAGTPSNTMHITITYIGFRRFCDRLRCFKDVTATSSIFGYFSNKDVTVFHAWDSLEFDSK